MIFFARKWCLFFCSKSQTWSLWGINFPSTPHYFTFYTLYYHFFFYDHVLKASVREMRPWEVAQCSLPNSMRAPVLWVQHLSEPCSDFLTVTTILVVASLHRGGDSLDAWCTRVATSALCTSSHPFSPGPVGEVTQLLIDKTLVTRHRKAEEGIVQLPR